jgi:hypothetical protein
MIIMKVKTTLAKRLTKLFVDAESLLIAKDEN